jgi:hypothetical protein
VDFSSVHDLSRAAKLDLFSARRVRQIRDPFVLEEAQAIAAIVDVRPAARLSNLLRASSKSD